MRKLWLIIGRIGFVLVWPLLWIYLQKGKRTRVVIIAEGKVLVVKGWLSDGSWSLPGGGLHYKEDPIVGAIREVREETGLILKPDQLRKLYEGTSKAHRLPFKYICYSAQLPKITSVKNQPGEIIESAWLEPTKINPQNASSNTIAGVQAWLTSSNLL